jgi:hypothetical protein
MEIITLNQLVLKSLEYYDEQCINYFDLINIHNNTQFTMHTAEIVFLFDDEKTKLFDCEILGYFDNQTNTWFWSWVLLVNNEVSKLTRELLEYGLKLDLPSLVERFYIKSLLVNSRIQLTEYSQLDTLLAICSYLLKTKIQFILPVKKYLDNNKKEYITFYYLVK